MTRVGGSFARVVLPAAVNGATFDAANRLTAVGGNTFGYDAAGNLTSDGESTYTWDARGQLVATSGAVGQATIAYDPAGRLAATTVDGTPTSLRWDGGELLAETRGGAVATYLRGVGVDDALARTDRHGTSALLRDGLGSTVATVRGDGEATAYSYQPYGAASSTSAEDPNPVRFTGRESGPGYPAGLQYQRGRWYSPGLGRFLSPDPIGEAGGPNLYAYALNDPTSYTDPSGLIPPQVVGCVIGAGADIAYSLYTGRKRGVFGAVLAGIEGCGIGAGLASLLVSAGKLVGGFFGRTAGRRATHAAGQACSRNSFDGDTPVLMADGTGRPIRDVRAGDEVLATDPVTVRTEKRAVTGVIVGEGDKHLVDVTLRTTAGDRTVVATGEHPFWVADQGRWVDAGDLEPGDDLRAPDGRTVPVVAVREYHQRRRVHNLEVDGLHTYHVLAGSQPVLAHNATILNCSSPLTTVGDDAFFETTRGKRIPIPTGSQGPVPDPTRPGVFRFTGGTGGGPGLHPKVGDLRIYDGTNVASGKAGYIYAEGYFQYGPKGMLGRRVINPVTGSNLKGQRGYRNRYYHIDLSTFTGAL